MVYTVTSKTPQLHTQGDSGLANHAVDLDLYGINLDTVLSVPRALLKLEKNTWYCIGEVGTKTARTTRSNLAKQYPDIEFRSAVYEDGSSRLFARVLVP